MRKWGLTGTQLKLIALVTMTVDHIGHILYPQIGILRIIGRLSLPLFAYMIAEGCRHTHNMGNYLLAVSGTGGVAQLVAWLATGIMRQNMLISFALAIGIIWLIKTAQKKKQVWLWLLPLTATVLVWLLDRYLVTAFAEADGGLDYGFFGVLLPVLIYMGSNFAARLVLAAVGLIALAMTGLPWQWWGLEALPVLALYNGRRGTAKLKWGFYIYYPAHLGIIQSIGWLIA